MGYTNGPSGAPGLLNTRLNIALIAIEKEFYPDTNELHTNFHKHGLLMSIFVSALLFTLLMFLVGGTALGSVWIAVKFYAKDRWIIGTLVLLTWVYLIILAMIYFDNSNPRP